MGRDLLMGLIILLIGILGTMAFFKYTGNNSFTGFAVRNPIKTCKKVQVPYQVVEEYPVDLRYEIISAKEGSTFSGLNYFKTMTVKVRNVDSETGRFTVRMFFETLNDRESFEDVSQYIMPGETKTFYKEYDSDLGEDVNLRYTITPGTKTLTRTVTKYRTEERCT